MHTLTETRPRVQNTCRLVLTIGDTDHAVRPVPMATTASTRAFALRAGDYGRFVVSQTGGGCRCTHSGCEGETACVHARALIALGLFRQPTTSPVIFPRPVASSAVTRPFAEGLEIEPPVSVVAPTPARVDAIAWSTAICGRLWTVATREQRDMAVNLLNRDVLLGLQVVPIGPSLEELRASL